MSPLLSHGFSSSQPSSSRHWSRCGDAKVPCEQPTQLVVGSRATRPAAHSVHSVPPGLLANEPGEHVVHGDAGSPSASTRPISQASQAVRSGVPRTECAIGKVPAGHTSHAVAESPSTSACPATHAAHSVAAAAANVPAEHLMESQGVAGLLSESGKPGSQSSQPVSVANRPGSQPTHSPPAWNLPGGQAVQMVLFGPLNVPKSQGTHGVDASLSVSA